MSASVEPVVVTANTSCILISGDNNGMEASRDTELFPNTLLEVVLGNFDIDVHRFHNSWRRPLRDFSLLKATSPFTLQNLL